MACKGKRVRSDTKAVVCNVYDYFERESKKNKKIHQGIVKLKKKMVDATGLSNPFATLILDFFFDLALVVTRRRRPRQQKVAQVSVTSCWRLADQGRKNELLGDSCWPAYGLSHTDDPLWHCPMHYATLLFFPFFF